MGLGCIKIWPFCTPDDHQTAAIYIQANDLKKIIGQQHETLKTLPMSPHRAVEVVFMTIDGLTVSISTNGHVRHKYLVATNGMVYFFKFYKNH